MIKAEIIVTGIVQKVGYRDFVQEIARKIGLKGYVMNLKDGSVKIVCEGEKENIEKFMTEINIKKDFINVEKVELVRTTPSTGEFEYFEIKYGSLEEELSERMVTAIKYAGAMWTDIKEMKTDIKEMKTDIKEMKSDIKEMKTDIKEMKTDIKEMKGDIKEIKENTKTMLKKQDETIEGIQRLNQTLKHYMDKRFAKIEKEIALIKQKIGLTW